MIEAQNTRKEALFVPQNIQRCFQRYEKKYLLNLEQYQKIRAGLAPYMEADEHGRYTICNLYYDTPDFGPLWINPSIRKSCGCAAMAFRPMVTACLWS